MAVILSLLLRGRVRICPSFYRHDRSLRSLFFFLVCPSLSCEGQMSWQGIARAATAIVRLLYSSITMSGLAAHCSGHIHDRPLRLWFETPT